MRQKLSDYFGYVLFLLFLVLISPILFITGGIRRIQRFYMYVRNGVKEETPKRYLW